MAIVEMKVPVIGESVTEVTLSEWLKGNGDYVNLDEPICEFESDKATLEFPAEAAGKLIYVAAEGDDLEIGALVAKIDTSAAGGDAPAPAKEEPAAVVNEDKELVQDKANNAQQPATTSYAAGHPSPAAAKVIAENGLSNVAGTGKDGRVTKEDAEKAAANAKAAPAPAAKSATPAAVQAPATQAFSRTSSRKKMSRMRRTIAKRLVEAKNETAMLTTFNEIDMSGIFKLRKTYQEQFVAKYGVKLGFMSLFAKACAKALMEKPDVNAIIDTETNEFIYHDYADISIAISTPNGLVVPPVHNVESLNFAEVELSIKALAKKAREGSLTLSEMSGGTFTITNGGIFGSLQSTPIINRPQSAILGMHSIQERPIAVNGEVVIRPMMYVALSYDHRIIDGSTSVTFLVRVKELLEDPTKLLLDI
jgi:2-oxoglutarate dehydrogenase E2 component (dihydrolipoamide succinyltransferase)